MEPAEPGDLIPDHSRQLGRDLLFRDWSGNQDRLVDQDEGAGDPGRSDDLENSKGKERMDRTRPPSPGPRCNPRRP